MGGLTDTQASSLSHKPASVYFFSNMMEVRLMKKREREVTKFEVLIEVTDKTNIL
jgi:hypothetical protein